MRRVFLINLAATLFMTGLIWYTQVVHYPLFERVGPDRFGQYQAENINLTALIVIPPMLAELLTTIWLHRERPSFITRGEAFTGFALVGLLWLTTAFAAAPLHILLGHAWDNTRFAWVLRVNWVRVVAWTARSFIVLRIADRLCSACGGQDNGKDNDASGGRGE